jgi:hypothetical protein
MVNVEAFASFILDALTLLTAMELVTCMAHPTEKQLTIPWHPDGFVATFTIVSIGVQKYFAWKKGHGRSAIYLLLNNFCKIMDVDNFVKFVIVILS